MKKNIPLLLAIFIYANSFAQNFMLQPAYPLLSQTFLYPIEFKSSPDTSNRMFVVEKHGKIFVLNHSPNTTSTKLFLDLSAQVSQSPSYGETGLLGIAFHPNFSSNGYFYVNYTDSLNGDLMSFISRFQVSPNNPDSALLSSKYEILSLVQPYSNHNGGCLNFGLDGYLYCAFGDGGSAGDPQGNGQNKSVLLGKMLRLNIDSAATPLHYSIPTDNPFYGNSLGFREEIFAYGLRNTWRFNLDSVSQKMWAGDVGQNNYEEIDIIENGANYGWNILEGLHCYNAPICDTTLKRKPIWEYTHSNSNISVTGGYVYRGSALPALYGKYIFGDYVSGRIWALNYDSINPASTAVIIDRPVSVAQQKMISSFGIDRQNNIYAISYAEGKIFEIVPDPTGNNEISVEKELFISQNSPNPFSGQTVFEFAVAKPGFVKLCIYNELGELINTVLNEQKSAGNYQVIFDAEKLTSGVYYYTFYCNEKSITKKMLRLK